MAADELSIVIERPTSEVFALLTDLDRAAEWAPQMGKIDVRGRITAGLKFKEERRSLGRSGVARWEVHRFTPDREVGFKMKYGPMRGEFVYRFEPLSPSTTRVAQDVSFRLWGPLAVFSGMLTGEARKEEARELERLKSLLESG